MDASIVDDSNELLGTQHRSKVHHAIQDEKKIIWIASYPKSGNTWVRTFINHLTHEMRGDGDRAGGINGLHKTSGGERMAHKASCKLKKPVVESLMTDFAAARPAAQAGLVRGQHGPFYVKTHNAVAQVEGYPSINFEVTRAAVYLVRNPLDVAISYAHHMAQPVEAAIDFMASSATSSKEKKEYMGTWSFHVASWTSVPHRPVLILRYEDMLAAPEKSFARLVASVI